MTDRPLTQEEQESIEKMQFQIMTSPQVTKEIVNKISQRIQTSKPLEDEFSQVIEDNFWNLIT